MPNERTPLIATVRVGPPRRRYPHHVLRRFCTIALSSTLIWFLISFFIAIIIDPELGDHGHHKHHHHLPPHRTPASGGVWDSKTHPGRMDYDTLLQILLESPSSQNEEEWSSYYTHGAHLAGQNYSQALWTKEKWEEFGVESTIVSYDCYLNRPLGHRVALLEQQTSSDAKTWKVAYEASLKEDVLDEDPTTSFPDSIPTFHGYSASGNVTGPVVFINSGTYQDFEDLVKANVSLKGKIGIAKYGGIFRGLKVKRAQELGLVGVLLYDDPGSDGKHTEKAGFEQYPNGPARQQSSVQRGSVQFLSFAPGDPTTPGYPSKPGAPRGPVDGYIPSIPSVPISYTDALPILKALNGHGPKAKDLNQWWTRNSGLDYLGVEYNIGPTPDDVVVNLVNEQEYITTPLWNVIGVINGTIPDEVVVIGNHRDAWIVGGAADPNSGSAVMNEAIRAFGIARQAGWKPLRTIVFASWDGEEYGLVGSTEWVEEYLPWLSKASVAYVNVDGGASGPHFGASAAPLLDNIIYAATAAVPSPNQTIPGQTVRDVWNGYISTMGSGSDFTAFQDFAGIPCINVGFGGGKEGPVYHYHSNYDSFYWMQNFGDPGFVYHRTMSQVLGVIIAQLSEPPVLSFSTVDYAHALHTYVKKVEDKLDSIFSTAEVDAASLSEEEIVELRASTRRTSVAATTSNRDLSEAFRISLGRLYEAVTQLTEKASELDARALSLGERLKEHVPWWKWPTKLLLWLEIRKVNTKYKYVERAFLYSDGLDGRPWFKHVVFAPGLWTGYAGAVFPGLVESIDAENWDNAARWVDIVEGTIIKATEGL
ncbi:Zn-dependent exopeptidase [Thozetella sp. PMI_491]|nr:Zn-dependent exopeptidase [Thozetella sp. PMI_491]